jgi:ABC-2 type transport system permease protein
VQPFDSAVESAAPSTTTITDFYAPAAVVLLVQQFGVAFAALTFVRERQIGILDVFRAAPLDAGETVVGKYLSYLMLGGLVAGVLTFMVVWVMGVPIAGTISSVAVALGLTLFASIGLGLIISLLSRTDSQAVQYTLLVLLASLFFSGFFLSVDQLSYPSRILSWLLPATYGMRLLRDTMLRGRTLDTAVVAALSAYGIVALAAVLAGTRRRLSVLR